MLCLALPFWVFTQFIKPSYMIVQPQNSNGLAKWYVVYTYPKAERKVRDKLEKIGVHSFLPLHEVIREWSDRKKRLVIPLFPNYIFVHTSERDRFESLSVKEIVRFVTFDGKPAVIKDSIIDSLKSALDGNFKVEIEDNIYIGAPVRITRGPFEGVEGVVVNKSGKTKLILEISALRRTVAITISSLDVALIDEYTSSLS